MQYENHKKAIKILEEIDKNPSNYLMIHYSCESFYDIKDGHTPRITSIAVYNYSSAQTESFSLHKIAEKMHVELKDVESEYDELEREMLREYYEYDNIHKEYYWIHWNMRDINYGFKAIEHRYSVLGGEPIKIDDNKKIDLSRLFIMCYGVNYIAHPRMQKLLEKNHIQSRNYLCGAEEATAFENKEYIKLHMSTLRKVDVFADLLTRAINNTLKTDAKWSEVYGMSPQGIFDYGKSKWWIQIILSIVTLFIGAVLGKLI